MQTDQTNHLAKHAGHITPANLSLTLLFFVCQCYFHMAE